VRSALSILAVVVGVSAEVACGSSGGKAPGLDARAADAAQTGEVGSTDLNPDGAAPADTKSDKAAPADAAKNDVAVPPVCRPDGGWDVPTEVPGTCSSFDDTDRDGVRDCIDGCPYDPLKIAKGACGCGIADLDSDGDGVADCLDDCEKDPHNIFNGQCGCVGAPGLVSAGVACSDPVCPQAAATCGGAGVCGDRSACAPCPGGHLLVPREGVAYWLCGSLPPVLTPSCAPEDGGHFTGLSRAAAQSACAAKGLSLARIQSVSDDWFLAEFITAPTWIGANDLGTPGQWYWSSATSDSDALFWSGAADGMQQNSLFSYWSTGTPAAGKCALIKPGDGHWSDGDCAQSLAYLCGYLQ
jgi:hypothetical protein